MTYFYKCIGLLSLGLGIVGAFLPLLPTTCFVLLSAWCFAKSSPIWYQRLCKNHFFGPMIIQWENNRCISTKVKFIALGSMLFFGGLSFISLESGVLRALIVLFVSAGAITVHYFNRRCLVA